MIQRMVVLGPDHRKTFEIQKSEVKFWLVEGIAFIA